jgi:hypothetical protein
MRFDSALWGLLILREAAGEAPKRFTFALR